MTVAIRRTFGGLLRRLARTRRLAWPRRVWWIVNYHDVSDDLSSPRTTSGVSVFRGQIDLLRKSCQVIGLQEGFARLRTGAIDGRFASITFDDGYAGVYEHAYPILCALKVPATVFVCGRPLTEGKETWDLALCRLLQAGQLSRVAPVIGIPADRLATGVAAAEIRRRWSYEMSEALFRLAERLPDPPPPRYMTMAQAADLDPSVLTVGNHSWTHPVVSSLTARQVLEEIGRNHRAIKDLPAFVPVFAYPFGMPADISPEATRIARDFFGLHVLSAHGGFNRNGSLPDRDIKRVGVTEDMQMPWDLTASAVAAVVDRLVGPTIPTAPAVAEHPAPQPGMSCLPDQDESCP